MEKEITCPIYYEEWKFVDLPGVVKNYYLVNNFGEVKNVHGQILRQQQINSGYWTVRLFKEKEFRSNDENRYKQITVHRLVMKTFDPVENQDELTVNHKNGIKNENYISNLEWMSQRENNAHSFETGLNKNFGENAHNTELTNDMVRTVCEMLQSKDYSKYDDILNRIGMPITPNNRDLIGNVKRRIAWKWMSKDYIW